MVHKPFLYSTCLYFFVLCVLSVPKPLSSICKVTEFIGLAEHPFGGIRLLFRLRIMAAVLLAQQTAARDKHTIYFDFLSRSGLLPSATLRLNSRAMLTNIVLQGPSRFSPDIIASVKTDIGVICCIYELAPTAI